MNRRQQQIAKRQRRERHIEQLRRKRFAAVNRQILDKAKELTGSDSKTALKIGISRQNLSDIRHGRRMMPPYAAAKLARLLKRQPIYDVLHALHQVSKSHKTREFWLDMRSGTWPGRLETYENWANNPKVRKYPCL